MKILVIGCGYVGGRVADLLHAAGHEVVGVTHTAESAARLQVEKPWPVRACDVSQHPSVTELAAEITPIDAFIHCASSSKGGAEVYHAVYVDGMRHLLTAFPAAFAVFTSSTSVYPQTDGSRVDESSPAEPARETGRLLRAAEESALQAGGSVARLAGIYGPERSFLLKNLLEGNSRVETTADAPDGRCLNQVHREDAAAALAHLATQHLRGIFNVVDDQPMTQRDCLGRLAHFFSLPMPADGAPDPARKRGWSHKHVCNARLRATGWQPQFPGYFDALRDDPDLAPSILDLVIHEHAAPLPRAENIILVGLMGSGKSTVGRIVAQKLGFGFVDTDALVTAAVGCSIPDIFASEGEAGFRVRESAALRSLLGCRHCVIATGGGIVTQPRNLPLLRHLGYTVWLDATPALLARRTATSQDRPLLQGGEDPRIKLERLRAERGPLYQQAADERIETDDLTQDESAYGVAEGARHFFATQRRHSQ